MRELKSVRTLLNSCVTSDDSLLAPAGIVMSSRMLRKLQGDGTVDVPDVTPKLEEDDDDDDNSIATARGARPRRPNLNPFDLVSTQMQPHIDMHR